MVLAGKHAVFRPCENEAVDVRRTVFLCRHDVIAKSSWSIKHLKPRAVENTLIEFVSHVRTGRRIKGDSVSKQDLRRS
jgi:hypothetical protein